MSKKLYVGKPNILNRAGFLRRIQDVLDSRWLSNRGAQVCELEERIQAIVGAKHCIAVCNATVGMEALLAASGVKGEVLMPSYTFVATAHACEWLGLKPVFVDILAKDHNICPTSVEKHVSSRTGAVIGVHLWGGVCNTGALGAICERAGLPVFYDAAHAFGSSQGGRMVGSFGAAEVFSFHATKFLNAFEGGAISTNDDSLAEECRLAINFGFAGVDRVVRLGTNGKMSEAQAAMANANLDVLDDLLALNRRNLDWYQAAFSSLGGVRLVGSEAKGESACRNEVAPPRPSRPPWRPRSDTPHSGSPPRDRRRFPRTPGGPSRSAPAPHPG